MKALFSLRRGNYIEWENVINILSGENVDTCAISILSLKLIPNSTLYSELLFCHHLGKSVQSDLKFI